MIRSLRISLLAAACMALATIADAATLMSTASGNIGTTATWSVVDTSGTNAFLNSETANTALTTSPVASSTFTPAAETVTSIGVKLASVAAAPSGTLTVKLANSTSAGNRECTQTVNVADLAATNGAPTAATADGGWIILTCSASPNGTDNYTITANTSVAAQVNLFSLATTNWSRLLVTSGTQVNGPAAGDKFYVFGQLTGAGTHNAYTVTIDTTSLVNYGNVANTLVDPSIAVGQWGTLKFASAASTAYVSEFAGPMLVYNGGTFSVGTSGTPIPSSSSATLTLNSTVEGDTGVNVRNGGTMNVAGSSGGRNVVKTKLASAATAAVTTSLTMTDSTGWLSGDSIIIAGTQITSASDATYRFSSGTLSGNASGTTVTLGSAVGNTHTAAALSYTSTSTGIAYALNMYADVILLNRNVVIKGSGSTTNGYLYFQANSIGAMTWIEFTQISGLYSVPGKRGLEVDTGPLGSFSLTNFSHHDSHNTSIVLAPTNTSFGGTAASYLTIQHGSIYQSATTLATLNYGLALLSTRNPYWKIDDIAVIRTANTAFQAFAMSIAAQNGQFTNISVSGCGNGSSAGLLLVNNYNSISTIGGGVGNAFGPITTYANVGYPISAGGSFGITGTISGLYIWHEQGRFVPNGNVGRIVYDPFYIINSAYGVYQPSAGGAANATFRSGVIGWDSSNNNSALTLDAVNTVLSFENMEICPSGALGGITFVSCGTGPLALLRDLTASGAANPSNSQVFLRNSSLLSPSSSYPSMGNQEPYFENGFIAQSCSACTPVKHGAWVAGGFLSYDTAISHSSGYSLRMTPKVMTFSGYIAGTSLTITSASIPAMGDSLTSNGAGFIPGTSFTAGAGTSFTVSTPQTVGSAGSPVQFQSYNNTKGALLRMQSAPHDRGVKVAVASGSTANVCVWVRPSISTDAAPPWGGSAVTYNADNPRLLVRANTYMGVASDTVLATFAGSAGAWSQLCGTTPTAPADGVFELVVDADQTFTSNAGGSVNIAEWSASSGAVNAVGSQQFFFDGVPFEGVVPASGGGLLVNPGMHGGMQ
jgi:hypothetical protein